MVRGLVAPLLVSATLLACAIPPVHLSDEDRAVTADEYPTQVRIWTRRGEMYKDFLSRLFAYATYRSWEFRQAQVAYRARTERLPDADVARLRDQERREVQAGHHFFLAAHTHEWAWNHLERTGDGAMWRMRLLNDKGDSVGPVSVRRVGQASPRYTPLYPFYKAFYVGYQVHFPRENDAGREILADDIASFTVRISGPQAVVDLTWLVTP